MEDRSFYSPALEREVTYRVMAANASPAKVRFLYLLHGNGGSYREWSESSDLATLAGRGFVMVMPEGGTGYFTDSASEPRDRYETFLTKDLIGDVEPRFVKAGVASSRSIAGVSMGGYAAVVLALKHPGMYHMAGALSPPMDVPGRRFSVRRPGQYFAFRGIFGPPGSATRAAKDPKVLARDADAAGVPFIFLSSGETEPLLPVIRAFDALLTARRFAHEFHLQPGGHDWRQWNAQLPALEAALEAHQP
jgi:S-formylglutathione hydrolase FrmB